MGSSVYDELFPVALAAAGRKAGNTAMPDALRKFLRLKAGILAGFWNNNVRRNLKQVSRALAISAASRVYNINLFSTGRKRSTFQLMILKCIFSNSNLLDRILY